MKTSYSIDEILAQLEGKKSAEEVFTEKIASMDDNNTSVPEEKGTANEQPFNEEITEEDIQKVAEFVEQGKILARAFMDELMKIAQELENNSYNG